MGKTSRLGESPGLWLDRWKVFGQRWAENATERKQYLDALENRWPALIPDVTDAQGKLLYKSDQTTLNLLERLNRRVKAMAYDESPEIRYPRDRRGAEKLAEGVDRMMGRVTESGGLPGISRDGVDDICIHGGYGVFTGMPFVPTAAENREGAKSIEDITVEATEGVHVPSRTQDHVGAIDALTETASDTVNVLVNPPEVTQALLDAAEKHAKMEEEERESGQTWTLEKGRVFFEHLMIGVDVGWDIMGSRTWRQSPWMIRCIRLRESEAHKHPALKARLRTKLKPRPLTVEFKEPGVPIAPLDSKDGQLSKDAERVEILECWDSRDLTVHYVAEGLDEYLEANETYPFMDPVRQRPAIADFCPIEIVAPYVVPPGSRRAGLPIPLFRSGWDKQLQLIKLDSFILQGVKRALVDKYGANATIPDEVLAQLCNGKPGWVKMPGGLNPKEALVSIDFKPPLQEAFAEREQCKVDFSIAVNFPLSELTSQPVADTASQEEMALTSGNQGTADIIKIQQFSYARIVDKAFALTRAFTPDEVLADIAGAQFVERALDVPIHTLPPEMLGQALKAYAVIIRAGPLAEERCVVRFGATSNDSNPVRVNQLSQFTTMLAGLIVQFAPMGGFPPAIQTLVDEMGRGLGIGDLGPMALPMLPPGTETGNGEEEGGSPAEGGQGGGAGTPPSRSQSGADLSKSARTQPVTQ